MRTKPAKILAWILLAASLFMAGKALASAIVTAIEDETNIECLFVADLEDSQYLQGVGLSIFTELYGWLDRESDTPVLPLGDKGVVYYAASGDRVLTNAPDWTKEDYLQESYMYVADAQTDGTGYLPESTFEFLTDNQFRDRTLYYAIPESTIQGLKNDWVNDRKAMMAAIGFCAFWSLISLAFIVYILAVSGRRPGETDLHLMKVDRWPTEILALAFAASLIGLAGFAMMGARFVLTISWALLSGQAQNALVLLMDALILAAVMLSLPLVRKLKAGSFFRDSILVRVLGGLIGYIRSAVRGVQGFFDGSPYAGAPAPKRIFRSQVTYICASAGLLLVCGFLAMVSYSFFFVLVFIVLELLATAWHVLGTRKALDEIKAGLDQSRQAQVKSENIKTALITNVSHDLKTPLTSIISYVDLLSREDGLSDAARDYVNVLAGKADRLNHMVSDLFDLSKSISGNIPLEMDVLDLRTLLEQTLADMKDRIETSGLTVKATLGEKPVPVFSDGKKLYRVFQNLIDNGLKYGLAGSRLFIDLTAGERMAEVAVKNTAAYEMDFTPEEILQRFTRGDKARSGEGSGLGLSIAESFTQSCGGRFAVYIDGDQFKATITLPIHDEGGR